MRWRRAARLVLALGGVGFAVAVYLMTRERPAPEAAPPTPPEDRSATQVGGPGKTTLTREGKVIGTVEFANSYQYADGRSRFGKVRLEDARGFTVTADLMHARGAPTPGAMPGEFDLEGTVVFRDKDSLQVETARAVYKDAEGLLTMPEEVRYARGRVSGRGVGAVYQRDTETIQLLSEASARVTPDESGKGAAEATSKTMTLVRGQKSIRLDEHARIVSEAQTLTGDTATIHFTDDESAVRFLELVGRAAVTPITPQPGGTPDMRGERISLSFHPDGQTLQHATLTGAASLQMAGQTGPRAFHAAWIDLFTAADGKTLTRLEARDNVVVLLPAAGKTPAREIRAPTLVATGRDDKGLEVARFEPNVRFTEKAPTAAEADRTATSRVLILTLGGDFDAITRAEFQRNAVFVDGDVRADADIAVYDQAKDHLALSPGTWTPRGVPRVRDERVTIDAPAIDIDLQTHDLTAGGGVTTRSQKAKERRTPALFEGDEPAIGSSATLAYQSAGGTAVYTGKPGAPARIVQGSTVIEGATITLTDEKGNLEASGGIRTVFVMAAADKDSKPVEYRTTAQTFGYDDATRVGVYRAGKEGALARMTGTDESEVEGRTITFTLAAESRTIDGFRVEREAWTRLPGNYEAVGETLTYKSATEVYVLTGSPAKVKSPNSDGKGCVLSTGETIEFNRKAGRPRQPQGQAFQLSRQIACTDSIR